MLIQIVMAVNKDEKVTPLVVKREAYSFVLVKFCFGIAQVL